MPPAPATAGRRRVVQAATRTADSASRNWGEDRHRAGARTWRALRGRQQALPTTYHAPPETQSSNPLYFRFAQVSESAPSAGMKGDEAARRNFLDGHRDAAEDARLGEVPYAKRAVWSRRCSGQPFEQTGWRREVPSVTTGLGQGFERFGPSSKPLVLPPSSART